MAINPTTYLNKLLQKTTPAVAPATIDTKNYIYMQTKWQEDAVWMVMQQTTTDKCFKGKFSYEDIKKSAAELDMPYETFMAECRAALTANISLIGFEYDIEQPEGNDPEEAVFRLTKKSDVEISYLMVPVKLMRNNYEMLDTAVEMAASVELAAQVSAQTTVRDVELRDEKMRLMETCRKEKKELEERLLTRFTLLLNSKKRRIRILLDQLADLRAAADSEAEGALGADCAGCVCGDGNGDGDGVGDGDGDGVGVGDAVVAATSAAAAAAAAVAADADIAGTSAGAGSCSGGGDGDGADDSYKDDPPSEGSSQMGGVDVDDAVYPDIDEAIADLDDTMMGIQYDDDENKENEIFDVLTEPMTL